MEEPVTDEVGEEVDVRVAEAVGVDVDEGLRVGSAVGKPLEEWLPVTEGLAPLLRGAEGDALIVLEKVGVVEGVATGVLLVETVPLGEAVALAVGLVVTAPLTEMLFENEGEAPSVKVVVGEVDSINEPEAVAEGVEVDVCVAEAVGVHVGVGLGVGCAVMEPLNEPLPESEGLAP